MRSLIQICLRQKNYDLYLLIYWPIATIEKKFSKSRKNFHNREKTFRSRKKFWNPEKYFRVKKNEIVKKITESRKNILQSRKIFRNREKNFRIEENFSKSRIILLQEWRKNLWNWIFLQHFYIIVLLHAYF